MSWSIIGTYYHPQLKKITISSDLHNFVMVGLYILIMLKFSLQVVDARAGPGTKSLTKFKSKKLKKNPLNPDKPVKEKIKKKHR